MWTTEPDSRFEIRNSRLGILNFESRISNFQITQIFSLIDGHLLLGTVKDRGAVSRAFLFDGGRRARGSSTAGSGLSRGRVRARSGTRTHIETNSFQPSGFISGEVQRDSGRKIPSGSCSGWQAHCRNQSFIQSDTRTPSPGSELFQGNRTPPGNSVQLRERVIGSKAHRPLAISCNSCNSWPCNSWPCDAFQHLGGDAYHHLRQYG